MDNYIHVKIGTVDGTYPVLESHTTGVLKDIYEYRKDAGTIAWVHSRWCTPCLPDGAPLPQDTAPATDTDWRKFLKLHWDTERGCLRTDCLDQFMAIFINAATAYMGKQQSPSDMPAAAEAKPSQKSKPRYIQLSLFD